MELNKVKIVLTMLTTGVLILVLTTCQLGSELEITKAEYTDENTFVVYYIGNADSIVNFNVKGKDKRYTIKSRASVTIIDTKVTCKIDDNFISGDRITVTSNEIPGSAEFDVPDYNK
jgi:hypothetical protein